MSKTSASKSVLISGGAGFIGSALSNRLIQAGYDVAVMDVLHPQVHARGRAIDLPASVRLFTGDVTHAPDWDAVLRLFEPSQVVHLAAETGTAQSLSEATRHGSVNVVGTTQLLDALSRSALVPDQLVLASSRAVYGEGAWQSGAEVFYPRPRSHAQLLAGEWDPQGPAGASATPLSSCADRTEPRPTNIYAGTKLAQEHLLASWAAAHDTNLSVLRLQPASYTGLDLNPDGISFCRRRHDLPGLEFVQGDAEDLPFPDESFDAVINVESSHLYPHFPVFLTEVARVLRPGGNFLYTDWLATPRQLPGRLEMETRRGRRLELEVVSVAIRLPILSGAVVRLPVFVMLMPAGSSPISGTDVTAEQPVD